ncbi:RNA-binding region-containing protein 3 [Anopheles marshallii]|uniref:RNA-binding region-containing protein 3 n=1 Tax=Anopheles marshallii TaxID=1521116 RepID=UPI00237B4E91|nr:RNA-binding region-containing protein 3 [Anopheles marshallii]
MASIALRIFNFPPMFSSVDVREFLHLFGLEAVRFIKRRNADGAIVIVNNESEARLVIARLHQLLIKTHRLKVEYSNKNEPDSSAGREPTKHKAVGTPEQRCFPIGFEGFPPPHLAYRYPKSSPEILENITKELASNSALYYQTLHLMNKMNLKPPFESRQKENTITPIAPEQSSQMHSGNLSEEESELESDSELNSTRKTKTSYNLLKHTMKVVNYEPSSVELQTTQKPPKKAKLEINISGALLTAPPPASPANDTVPETVESIPYTQEEAPTLSIEDIVSNRIPDEQRKTLNVFQNYSPGEPTNKLYIKNLAKQVTEQDLMALFGMFFQAKLLKTIDVRLMKTGRMKGQAFVTFVPVEEDEDSPGCGRFRQCIERALSTVNGYILKDKPIVVSYAKSV